MNAPRLIAATALALATCAPLHADDNVFVRGKDKFLEVTEKPKNVVKGVGKDIGYGFRGAWRRLSNFVTGREPQPEYPQYQTGPYTPPPQGYAAPNGTNYAPGYGPPVTYRPPQAPPRYNPPARPPYQESPYVTPVPPDRSQPAPRNDRGTPPPRNQPAPPRNVAPATPKKSTPPSKPSTPAKPKTTAPTKKTTKHSTPDTPSKPTRPTPNVEKEKPEPKPTPPTSADGKPPFAVPIPGKAGMVYSPFAKGNKPVDVRDIPAGTVVKDPYTNKLFRVP